MRVENLQMFVIKFILCTEMMQAILTLMLTQPILNPASNFPR